MVETNFDRRALAEVYNVLIMLNKENFERIPTNIIEAIKNNMDTEYEVQWEQIEEGNMLEDAEKILSVIYTDYLATPEEKSAIMQLENLKYKDSYPVLKKRIQTNNKLKVIKKEKWIIKIIKKIKELLKL